MAQSISINYASQLFNLGRESRGYVEVVSTSAIIADTGDLINVKIDADLQVAGKIYGNAMCRYAEIKLQNPANNTHNLIGEYVEVFLGLTLDLGLVTESVEYVSQGKFKVLSDSKDLNNETIILECYDDMIKFNIPFVTSATYPLTLGELAQNICDRIPLTLATPVFTNSTFSIATPPNVTDGEQSLRDILGWIAEASLGNAYIGKDGQVYIGTYGSVSALTIPPTGYFELSSSDAFGPVDSVVIGLQPQNDIIFRPTELPVPNISWNIVNNAVIENQREDIIDTLYTQSLGFTYTPFSMEWSTGAFLDFMDKITIERLDATTFVSYVTNSTITFGDGALLEVLNTIAYSPEVVAVKYGLGVKQRNQMTSLAVDKVNQEILAVVQDIEGTDGIISRLEVAEFKLTPSEITSTVKTESGIPSGETISSKTYVEQTASSYSISAADAVRDEYGDTISDIQTNFVFDTSGLTISKSTSDFAVKISDTEMGFYDGSTKTAYVNNDAFAIRTGVVENSLTIGSHKIEQYSSGITIFRYVG